MELKNVLELQIVARISKLDTFNMIMFWNIKFKSKIIGTLEDVYQWLEWLDLITKFIIIIIFLSQVAWIKSDSKAILAIHTVMVALNPRLSVTHNGHNTWKLHISHVELNDSGSYMCQGMLYVYWMIILSNKFCIRVKLTK